MLKEAIDRVAELGKNEAEATVVHLNRSTSVLVVAGSVVKEYDRLLPPIRHQCLTLDSFIQAATEFSRETGPRVFLSPTKAVAVLNHAEERIETVTLDLTYSDRWKALVALSGEMPHDKLVKLLAVTLRGSVDEALVRKIRRVEFASTGSGKSEVQHGRDTMGKAVEAVVSNIEDIPESFIVSVPVYSNADIRQPYPVELVLEINTRAQTFTVVPSPDELTKCQQQAAGAIVDRLVTALKAENVFEGSPQFVGAENMLKAD